MRLDRFLPGAMLVVGSACATDTAGLPPHTTLIVRNGTIVSAERAAPLANATLVIADGRIVWTGSGAPPRRYDGARSLDATGQFVVPGLIDAHAHVGHTIALTEEQYDARRDLVALYETQVPRSYLYFGFTTLVDPDLRESTRSRWSAVRVAPALIGCGRGIRIRDGYGPAMFLPALRERMFPVWVDAGSASSSATAADTTDRRPDAVVDHLVAAGARCIKTYHESGFGIFAWPVPTDTVLRNLADAAHRHALSLMLHATGLDGYEAGVRAGVDIIGHGLWHWPGSRLDTVVPPAVRAVVAQIAARGIGVMPTMRVIEGEYDTWRWSLLDHPLLADVLPPEWLDWLRSDAGRWPQRELRALYARHLPAEDAPAEAYLDASRARVRSVMRLMRDARVRVLFGSDTPASDGIGNPPGLNGRLEIAAWADAGIPAAEIFDALTRRNALAFGLGDEIGTVEKGKRADLLLLDRNPQIDPAAYDDIAWVIVGGIAVARHTLSARSGRPSSR